MYLSVRNENNSVDVVRGPLLVGRSGALTSPLNLAFLRSGAREKRVKKSNERSGVQKIKWRVSGAGAGGRRNGNGAVSETPVNGAKR